MTRHTLMILAAFTTLSLTATNAPAQTGEISRAESDLAAAGFQARIADTPERQAMLARLPARKMLLRSYNNTTHYVYADPKGCNCIYVGDDAAFQSFTQARRQRESIEAQETVAQNFADPSWNWGARGGFGPGFLWGRTW